MDELQKKMADRKNKMAELQKAAEPLIRFLIENYDPYTTASVTSSSVGLTQSIMGIPNILMLSKD